MKNEKKLYLYNALEAIVVLLTSGTLLQNFLLEIGLSDMQIASYNMILNVVQTISMLFSLIYADSIRNLKKAIARLIWHPILNCVIMLSFCFNNSRDIGIGFRVIIAFCCVQNMLAGFCSVLKYRFSCLVINREDYTRVTNNISVISNVCSIGVSGVITFLSVKIAFKSIMAVGFALSVVFCLLVSWLVNSMEELRPFDAEVPKNVFSIQKLLRKDFCFFYIPNFLRGVVNGAMGLMLVFCSSEITSNLTVLSSLSTILLTASVLGSVLYKAVRNRYSTAAVYMGGSIIMCVFLPMMLAGRNAVVYCVFYFVVCIGYLIVSNAGVIHAMEIMNYYDIGTFSAIRLIVMAIGQAVASYGFVFAMNYIPLSVIFLICGLCQLCSGFFYLRYRTDNSM